MGPQSLLWEREIAVKSGCGEYFVKCKDGNPNQETWIRDVTMIEWITSPSGHACVSSVQLVKMLARCPYEQHFG
jgi:hypothetical protein